MAEGHIAPGEDFPVEEISFLTILTYHQSLLIMIQRFALISSFSSPGVSSLDFFPSLSFGKDLQGKSKGLTVNTVFFVLLLFSVGRWDEMPVIIMWYTPFCVIELQINIHSMIKLDIS